MAAFCGCCGAEISERAEVCAVCGTPRHGMVPAGFPTSLAGGADPLCCPAPGAAEEKEDCGGEGKVSS